MVQTEITSPCRKRVARESHEAGCFVDMRVGGVCRGTGEERLNETWNHVRNPEKLTLRQSKSSLSAQH